MSRMTSSAAEFVRTSDLGGDKFSACKRVLIHPPQPSNRPMVEIPSFSKPPTTMTIAFVLPSFATAAK